jgi:hypothetical protein
VPGMASVWEYSQANKLCCLVWDSYEAIVHVGERAWRVLITDPGHIRSMGSRERTCVNLQGGWYTVPVGLGRTALL